MRQATSAIPGRFFVPADGPPGTASARLLSFRPGPGRPALPSAGDRGAIASGAHVGNERSLAVQRKLGFVEVGRRLRFVQALDRDIEHIETELTRDRFTAAGSSE